MIAKSVLGSRVDGRLERRNHEAGHLDALFDAEVQVGLDVTTFFSQHVVLVLHLLQSDCDQFVLSFLRLNLFFLVHFLFFEVFAEGRDAVDLIFVLLLELVEHAKLVLVPVKVFLHPYDALVVVEFVFLVHRLVLKKL